MNHITEKELLQQFVNGNQRSLETLINRYKDKLFTSIYLLVRDTCLAEDIFQDTFIKVIDMLRKGQYNDEGKFVHWATRIARNLCIDHFRRNKKMSFIKRADDTDLFSYLDVRGGYESDLIEKRQTHDRVREMLDALPEEQREVIVLRHYADLSFAEIAKLNNCSINTALGRMRYGLLNLRKMAREHQMAL